MIKLVLALTIVSSSSTVPAESVQTQHVTVAQHFDNMYVLGDSLSDGGALTGLGTAFMSYHSWVTAGKLQLGNPFYQKRSFCNGKVAVEHLADSLGLSLTAGWNVDGYNHVGNNYAFGGSSAAKTNAPWYHFDIASNLMDHVSLESQYDELMSQHKNDFGHKEKNDLVVIETGNNDLFNELDKKNASDLDDQKTVANAIQGINNTILNLLKTDSFKDIVVTNVANLANTPRYNDADKNHPHDRALKMVKEYNEEFKAMINGYLSSSNGKSRVHMFDLYSTFNTYFNKAKDEHMDVVNSTVHKNMGKWDLVKDFGKWGDGVIKMTYVHGKTKADLDNNKDLFLDTVHPTEWLQNKIGQDLTKFIVNDCQK